jgi:hypothetical protein
MTANPGRSERMLALTLAVGLCALPVEAQVTSFQDAAAHAEAALATTVRALLAGGDAIPGENRTAELVRAVAADHDGSVALVMVEKRSSTQRMHPDLDPATLPGLALRVARALRAEGQYVSGATETREPARPRATRRFWFEDGSLAAECPIGTDYSRYAHRCVFHPNLDMIVQLGHPVPFRGGLRVPAAVFREHGSPTPTAASFTVILSVKEGRWAIDEIFLPF